MPDINMQVFEEARRNQLVTEIDIQTQAALDDYQVQLSDITNPTQSQDNVIIDRFGGFLPHWNESLDFDTWVKMSMEVSGKKILILRGNSSVGGASNGDDTFLSFFDGNSTRWTEVDPNSHLSFVNNRLEFTGLGRNEDAYVYQIASENNNIIIESSYQVTSGDSQSIVLIGAVGDIIDDFANMDNGYTLLHGVSTSQSHAWIRLADANYTSAGVAPALNTNYFSRTVRTGNTVTCYWYTDSARTNLAYSTSKTQATIPTDLGYLYLMSSWNSGSAQSLTGWVDDFRVRKYTATEPTWIIDNDEQNIVVALKSLGRAG